MNQSPNECRCPFAKLTSDDLLNLPPPDVAVRVPHATHQFVTHLDADAVVPVGGFDILTHDAVGASSLRVRDAVLGANRKRALVHLCVTNHSRSAAAMPIPAMMSNLRSNCDMSFPPYIPHGHPCVMTRIPHVMIATTAIVTIPRTMIAAIAIYLRIYDATMICVEVQLADHLGWSACPVAVASDDACRLHAAVLEASRAVLHCT